MDLMQLLITVVIAGLIFYLLFWFIGFVGLPEPFDKVAKVILALVVVIFLLSLLTGSISLPVFKLR